MPTYHGPAVCAADWAAAGTENAAAARATDVIINLLLFISISCVLRIKLVV
jgi:hypothetical protein